MPHLRLAILSFICGIATFVNPAGGGPPSALAAVGCSLNDPEGDLRRFFPELTDFTINFVSFAVQDPAGHDVLAGKLESALDPVFETPDVPYTLYTVHSNGTLLGHVFGANQRGTYSNLQVIAVTGPDLSLTNVYLQKIRSPDYAIFQSEAFLGALGKVSFATYGEATRCFNTGECGQFPVPDPTEGRNVEDFHHIVRAIAKLHHLRSLLLRPGEVIAPRGLQAVNEWIASWWMPEKGFLPVDTPSFISASEADEGLVAPETPVVAWHTDEGVHVFPVNVLSQHPLVHDRIGGRTAAISWSPSGQTAFVLNTSGRTDVFSNTSNTLFGDQTLIDRDTQSEWSPALGRALSGPRRGEELVRVGAALVLPWRMARQLFPHAQVMTPPHAHSRFRRTWAAHRERYVDAARDTLRVLVAYSGDKTLALPLSPNTPSGMTEVLFDDMDTLFVHDGGAHALFDRRVRGQTLDFERGPRDIARGVTLLRDRQTGTLWRGLTGKAIRGPLAGERLTALPLAAMPAATWAQIHAASTPTSNTP